MNDERLAALLAESKRPRMVGWYDPRVLAQTALHMTTANIFGRHSDSRLVEALANHPQGHFDYSQTPGEFWLDYVCDVGDGWNPTMAIASAVAARNLDVTGPDGETVSTMSGRVLVFGGDEVYPWPSRASYEWRTEFPYAAAFAGRTDRPDLYAIPGNHDWFDSLVAFSRTFCRPERGFAGCRTQQTRSYFALKLPHKWWLVAIDLQLGAELDEPQVRYLQRVAQEMEPDARVILCVPEPQWIYERAYPTYSTYADDSIRHVEERILGRRIEVYLTGDLHHYRRHANAEGVQKIVSGGGGAFLHPTHAPAVGDLPQGFVEQAVYPDTRTSWRLSWRNLLFPLLNPRALLIPAVLYVLSAWFASASLTPESVSSFASALETSLNAALRDPVNGLWLLTLVAGFIFFTDTHVRWYRVIGGATHAIAHLAAAFALAWGALVLTTQGLGLGFGSNAQLLIAGALTFVGGGIIGGLIIGLYLLFSVTVLRRHSNEAFSSLRIQDYKQWLRLSISKAGALTIHAIAIDRVARNGRAGSAPRLIDKVVLRQR